MLTSLLPGIRELRAPLAAGYLWLAALWVLFAHDVPARPDAEGPWADAYRFVDAASVFGLAAAISFAAYLIGTLSVATSDWLGKRVNGVLPGQRDTQPAGEASRWVARLLADAYDKDNRRIRAADPSLQGHDSVDAGRLAVEAVAEGLRRRVTWDIPADTVLNWTHVNDARSDLESRVTADVLSEFPRVTLRLLGRDPEMYGVIDRTRSEAQFRYAVSFALLPLAGAVAWRVEPPYALLTLGLAIAGSALLWARGRTSERESNSYVMDAIVLGRATPPVLDPLLQPAAGPEPA
jgi:hypothetical protein